ncbi:MAG: 2-phosphosulfolactate phosphatase [Vicingaceae bacterium]|nr:2-phosphosulfolactate phosphatase [Vicingaceae bacterium]
MGEISSENKNNVEVCFSPALFPHYFENESCVVVVIDVLRATTAICSAFENGIKSLIPVETVKEAEAYKKKGYLVGAERNAQVISGFDFGNSPLAFYDAKFKNQTIVLTTTNGTKAIHAAKKAHKVIVGAFTNLNAVCTYLEKEDKNVLLLCAGWKDKFNLEDSLFAGAVVEQLSENLRFTNLGDGAIGALNMYKNAKGNLFEFLGESSHRKRLSNLNLEEDIIYCLTLNKSNLVPIFKEYMLVLENNEEIASVGLLK